MIHKSSLLAVNPMLYGYMSMPPPPPGITLGILDVNAPIKVPFSEVLPLYSAVV